MIVINLGYILTKKGFNVMILDYDLAAPNLHTYLGENPNHYINDYYDGLVELDQCIIDLSKGTNGKLLACFANPSSKSIDEMMKLDEDKATFMLKKFIDLKKIIATDYHIDYLLIDTSPGIGLTVVNAFIISDRIMFVVRFSKVDIESTINMLNGFEESINDNSMLVINMVPPKLYDKGRHHNLDKLVTEVLQTSFVSQSIQFGGWIPTDQKFMEQEFEIATKLISGYDVKIPILVNSDMNLPFSKAIEKICNIIVGQKN